MDISTLRGLTRLTNLHVHDLPDLSDIQPLLNNSGLGAGDRVILFNSDISCEDAATLQTKGVSVGSGCLRVILMQEWRSILAALAVCAGRRCGGRRVASIPFVVTGFRPRNH